MSLTSTFEHCRGIGSLTNRRLIEAGYLSWADALQAREALPLPARLGLRLRDELEASMTALACNDIAYFVACFPTAEKWRILAHYWEDLSFLDIETSGLSPYTSEVTVAALWHAGKLEIFVRGQNLDELLAKLLETRLVVTFGGGAFDLPRLCQHFHIPEFPCPHIDLRWQCFHRRLSGGQKRIEIVLGLQRPAAYAALTGLAAIDLWQRYRSGEAAALDELIDYVSLDVAGLRAIAAHLVCPKAAGEAAALMASFTPCREAGSQGAPTANGDSLIARLKEIRKNLLAGMRSS